jgi:hypothetical protein
VWVTWHCYLISFTTKITKDTKGSDICESKLRAFRTGKDNHKAVASHLKPKSFAFFWFDRLTMNGPFFRSP